MVFMSVHLVLEVGGDWAIGLGVERGGPVVQVLGSKIVSPLTPLTSPLKLNLRQTTNTKHRPLHPIKVPQKNGPFPLFALFALFATPLPALPLSKE